MPTAAQDTVFAALPAVSSMGGTWCVRTGCLWATALARALLSQVVCLGTPQNAELV